MASRVDTLDDIHPNPLTTGELARFMIVSERRIWPWRRLRPALALTHSSARNATAISGNQNYLFPYKDASSNHRARPTRDKVVARFALTTYPYSLDGNLIFFA